MDVTPKGKGLILLDDGLPIPFLYNPNEIEEGRSVQYAEKFPLARSHPRIHYQYGKGKKISWPMSARNKMRVGSIEFPYPLEVYIDQIYDLTYPIFDDSIMIAAPPTVLVLFGTFVRAMKFTEVNVTVKKWSNTLIMKYAELSINCIEITDQTRQRINSFKNLGL